MGTDIFIDFRGIDMAAEKPYIYVGGGAVISEAAEEVTAFAKKILNALRKVSASIFTSFTI